MLRRNALLGAALIAAGKPAKKKEPEISPTEDLMREHGLLNRVLLVYEECARRLEAGEEVKVLPAAAKIIRDFIEGYHEQLEEQQLFPRFRKADKLTDLVGTLQAQHAAGRRITAQLLAGAPDRSRTPRLLRSFSRMYRPHEAREDTVLFPAFRELVGEREWDKLGDIFEDREHQLFGERGFEGKVDEVAGIEQALGIADLARFTPSGS
ncbi:MAG TPA: hemerythrin domain-containing protein [Myxococcales bacterium]